MLRFGTTWVFSSVDQINIKVSASVANFLFVFYKACKTRKSCLWVFADLEFKFDVKKSFSFKTSIVKFLSLADWELW